MIQYSEYSPNIYLCTLLLFFALGPLQSQTSGSYDVIGSWQFDSESSFAQRAKSTSDLIEAHPPIRSKLLATYIGKTVTFFENGRYQQELGNGGKSSGKWSMEKNYLLISAPGDIVYRFNFSITGNRLLLQTISDNPDYKSLVPNQYFTKIQ